jgi:hypothetical protein
MRRQAEDLDVEDGSFGQPAEFASRLFEEHRNADVCDIIAGARAKTHPDH